MCSQKSLKFKRRKNSFSLAFYFSLHLIKNFYDHKKYAFLYSNTVKQKKKKRCEMLPLEVFVIFKFFHVLATIREKVENGKKKVAGDMRRIRDRS